MKFYLYAYYNKEGDFFGNIFSDKVSPEEYKDSFIQGLVGLKDDVLESLKVDDLYYLGVFDNISGEIEYKKEFLLHVSDIVSKILAKRIEATKDGNTEEDA